MVVIVERSNYISSSDPFSLMNSGFVYVWKSETSRSDSTAVVVYVCDGIGEETTD